jgi:hypothetical protein
MSERWLTELRRMGRMEPSGNLLERAERMPQLPPEPGPSPAARLRVVLIALLVAVAGFWGVFAALNGAIDERQAAGSETFALWPETSLAEAQQVQSRVDAGDQTLQWRTDAASVALQYGQDVLGWPHPIAGVTMSDVADTVVVSLHGPDATCQGTACEPQSIVTMTLERLVRSGDGGIWSVTAVDR